MLNNKPRSATAVLDEAKRLFPGSWINDRSNVKRDDVVIFLPLATRPMPQITSLAGSGRWQVLDLPEAISGAYTSLLSEDPLELLKQIKLRSVIARIG